MSKKTNVKSPSTVTFLREGIKKLKMESPWPEEEPFWNRVIISNVTRLTLSKTATTLVKLLLTSKRLARCLNELESRDIQYVFTELLRHGKKLEIDWLEQACRDVDIETLAEIDCVRSLRCKLAPRYIRAGQIMNQRLPRAKNFHVRIPESASYEDFLSIWSVIDDDYFQLLRPQSLQSAISCDQLVKDRNNKYIVFFSCICDLDQRCIKKLLLLWQGMVAPHQAAVLADAIKQCRKQWQKELTLVLEQKQLYEECVAKHGQLNSMLEQHEKERKGPRDWWQIRLLTTSKPALLSDRLWSALSKQVKELDVCAFSLTRHLKNFEASVKLLYLSQARVLLECELPIYVVYQIMADVCFFVKGMFGERELIDVINRLGNSVRAVKLARLEQDQPAKKCK